MSGHHAAGDAIDGDQLQNVAACEQAHASKFHLAHQGLIGPIQQLLPRLSAGIKGAAHQCTPKTSGGQASAVFPSEGNPLGDALINDAAADFGQPLTTGFAGSEVAPFQRVAEQSTDAVAIDRHGTGGINAPLRCHRMGAPWAVMETQHRHPVTLLGQRCSG